MELAAIDSRFTMPAVVVKSKSRVGSTSAAHHSLVLPALSSPYISPVWAVTSAWYSGCMLGARHSTPIPPIKTHPFAMHFKCVGRKCWSGFRRMARLEAFLLMNL
mmetsp:Transcript_4862/g.12800  ORF Transcript_4862/g.12800 Transcript_4862/m.12800 type:complete len:105 (-) Transcript_4862:1134-1448(-)